MKNRYLYKGLLVMGLLVTMLSCSKKDEDPAPATTNNNNNNNDANGSTVMCGDSICNLPFRIMPIFNPSGFYEYAEQTVRLKFDSCGETPKYENEGLRIVYTHNGGYWGASFLNDNNWAGGFKVSPKAKKITFYVKTTYLANVTFNAFADKDYGFVKLEQKATPLTTPVWEKITITLLGKPTTFNAPLGIVIDGVDGDNLESGDVIVVDIKDLLIEE